MPSVEELKAALAEAQQQEDTQRLLATSVPPQNASEGRYAPSVWGSNEYDFQTPSGQLCRLRKLPLDKLAETGLLDRITRLPGLAGELVNKSQGLPPEQIEMPPAETVELLVEILDKLLPLVIVAPEVWPLPPEGEERLSVRIYVDSIDLGDRVAILEKAVGPLVKLDSFRNQS